MASHKTTKGRSKRQKKVRKYGRLKEDLQIAGVIPILPEEAVRSEVVDPKTQSEQPLPGLIGIAIRRGWAVPEEKKPRLVDEMVGIIENPEVGEVPKIMAFNALNKGDQVQYERDNPEAAGKAKGKTEVNVGVVVDPYSLYKKAVEDVEQDMVEQRIEQEQIEVKDVEVKDESNGEIDEIEQRLKDLEKGMKK